MAQIFFKYTNVPYGWLSNFSLYPIRYYGEMYATSEHLYQSLKFSDLNSAKLVRETKTAKEAAQLGRTLPGMISNWDDIKIDVMEKVLWEKVDQHEILQKWLLETGEAEIIEESKRDSFWGNGPDGKGRNELGKLWMKIREELRLREEKNDRRINWN